ncbi:putative btb poz fold domain containing protein [Phaeoacremonium minimum UCRPA7]|uniref:Putative btb poz fold domain containing protein n=1 Tax=Phaeoacremonium minimum (strain UCR-PA7) TaxID=1286976 RepID=R8BR22_PHAM7|nr:putative btb poz fold domain containing protein [Phaeoacremonium minimum UCRPA7]EOO01797.1 putative btb poz fold domain containing protein [Phaeoacremonium minimum UCRPA7]
MDPGRIILYVGEEQFITTRTTLVDGMADGSQYLAQQFSFGNAARLYSCGGVSQPESPVPSSYFHLDLDPGVFRHALDYLRSGVMLFLWTEEDGLDYIAYAKLEKMAEFLQIERLRAWLSKRRYLEVVEYVHRASRETLPNPGDRGGASKTPTSWRRRCAANVTCSIASEPNASGYRREKEVLVVTRELIINNKVLFDEE